MSARDVRAGFCLVSCLIIGASSSAWAGNYKAPRTDHGHPDLQGFWTNASVTPLERDPKFGDRLELTAQEAKAVEKAANAETVKDAMPTDPSLGILELPDCGEGVDPVDCGYNSFWIDPGTELYTVNGAKRSSIIVDPKNGRIPPLTPEGEERAKQMIASYRNFEGPEARPLGERCLMSFDSSAGPPMLPLMYNNMYQIVQTEDHVMIHIEMVHDTRIVDLNGKHLPASIRPWMGSSVGRWEGETLVIETKNINPKQLFQGAAENLQVTERITRIGPTQMLYRFTVVDPTTFTKPFTGELIFTATPARMHEYACHEGNYALPGILAGAREHERAAAEKKSEGTAVKRIAE